MDSDGGRLTVDRFSVHCPRSKRTKTPGRGAEGFGGRRADGILSDGGGLRKGAIQHPWRSGSLGDCLYTTVHSCRAL